MSAFPRIYVLATNKDGMVSEYGRWVGSSWSWVVKLRRTLFGWELQQWNCFMLVVNCIIIRNGISDDLAWNLSSNRCFSVKSFRRCLEDSRGLNISEVSPLLWRGLIPPKVEVFIWQLLKGRVVVREVLVSFGMVHQASTACPLCDSMQESINHLFLHCDWSWKLWSSAMNWWGISSCRNS
ncbi:hypothetical protein Dsin_014798 [Dipteronia sinensis]|uniref:Reverse transcriptase zinc-binding domain-containing protein n=1 Tax=Dipteronia sinensis TaxID=43782 RepID=A0AAE0AMM1_9ROSI|nr:hypothetical protein Dsin_014798 [Dipteronia sinensis]